MTRKIRNPYRDGIWQRAIHRQWIARQRLLDLDQRIAERAEAVLNALAKAGTP